MSTLKVNAVTDASGGNTATINSMTPTADSLQGFRNRIINGDMRIDQRNAGASQAVTTSDAYCVDRFVIRGATGSGHTIQQVTDAPSGFNYSAKFTVGTGGSPAAGDRNYFRQSIEGYNFADLMFGISGAKTSVLSFWVKSSLTGTFSGAYQNESTNRSYPFTYSVSVADTWEYKTVTIAGDTTGTWNTTNGIGNLVYWDLGTGSDRQGTAGAWAAADYRAASGSVKVIATNGATWYITGVQLEVGSVATPFERRDYGRQLALCQRYYYKMFPNEANNQISVAYGFSTTGATGMINFPVTMRIAPAALEQSGTAADYRVYRCGSATNVICSSVPVFSDSQIGKATVNFTVASGLTNGSAGSIAVATTSGYLAWSAEL